MNNIFSVSKVYSKFVLKLTILRKNKIEINLNFVRFWSKVMFANLWSV